MPEETVGGGGESTMGGGTLTQSGCWSSVGVWGPWRQAWLICNMGAMPACCEGFISVRESWQVGIDEPGRGQWGQSHVQVIAPHPCSLSTPLTQLTARCPPRVVSEVASVDNSHGNSGLLTGDRQGRVRKCPTACICTEGP